MPNYVMKEALTYFHDNRGVSPSAKCTEPKRAIPLNTSSSLYRNLSRNFQHTEKKISSSRKHNTMNQYFFTTQKILRKHQHTQRQESAIPDSPRLLHKMLKANISGMNISSLPFINSRAKSVLRAVGPLCHQVHESQITNTSGDRPVNIADELIENRISNHFFLP